MGVRKEHVLENSAAKPSGEIDAFSRFFIAA